MYLYLIKNMMIKTMKTLTIFSMYLLDRHLWKELNKFLLIIIGPGTIADLNGNVSPLQRQLRSFSSSEWARLFLWMRFLFQLFARKCHCGLWPDQNLAWPKKEAEEVRTWKNLCGFYLPVNTRHRPTSLRHCQVGPMVGQILPCEPSKRPADFHKTWTKERKRSEAPALRTLARFLKQQFRNFAKWCF